MNMNVDACICVCVYVCVYACIRKRRYLYISYIVYICDILVLYKFSIMINPASWLQHANKEYYYYYYHPLQFLLPKSPRLYITYFSSS